MNCPWIEVSYAAATYAAATGAPVGPNLFAYRSEPQLLIAAAVYESFGGKRISWRKVALAVFCPNEKNKIASLDMGVRHRQKRNAFDPVLFAACKAAAAQKRLIPAKVIADPAPEARSPAKPIPVVRRDPPPARPRAKIVPPGERQIIKPASDIDREIYGAPLIAPRKIDPRAAYPTMPIPGDKPDDWKPPPPEPTGEDDDAEVTRVDSLHSERLGHRAGPRLKKISLPRIRALEKELPDE